MARGGPYSHAVVAGETMYISGQTGLDGNNQHDFRSQFIGAINNIDRIAKSAEMSIKNIVKIVVYISDKKYFRDLNEVFGEYFEQNPPARTTIVSGFVDDKILVEIDAILH